MNIKLISTIFSITGIILVIVGFLTSEHSCCAPKDHLRSSNEITSSSSGKVLGYKKTQLKSPQVHSHYTTKRHRAHSRKPRDPFPHPLTLGDIHELCKNSLNLGNCISERLAMSRANHTKTGLE